MNKFLSTLGVAITLTLLLSSKISYAAFEYGHMCPTVEAALVRIAQERQDAAIEAFKTGKLPNIKTPANIPGQFQGYWALPDCKAPDVTTIYTKYFSYSIIFEAEACLQKVRNVAHGLDYTEVNIPSDNIIKQLNDDQSLTAGFTIDDQPADLSKSWQDNVNQDSMTFTFKNCPALDPEYDPLHKYGLKAIRYLDHAVDICNYRPELSFADNSDCHHLLYVMADKDVSFELTKGEIIDALVMLNYLSFVNHNGAAIDGLKSSLSLAKKKANIMADLALAVMDEDKNGGLKREEIEAHYKKLPNNSPEWTAFQKNFQSLGNMFPSFAKN